MRRGGGSGLLFSFFTMAFVNVAMDWYGMEGRVIGLGSGRFFFVFLFGRLHRSGLSHGLSS